MEQEKLARDEFLRDKRRIFEKAEFDDLCAQ